MEPCEVAACLTQGINKVQRGQVAVTASSMAGRPAGQQARCTTSQWVSTAEALAASRTVRDLRHTHHHMSHGMSCAGEHISDPCWVAVQTPLL